ncbi:MAG TPA: glycosyltransferase [Planctomycetota bacterium]|nr:glycosyltransferase [Planctomycetota bacterium]
MFFGKNMSRTRCTGALVDGLAGHGLDIRWINYATVRRWLRPGLAHAWVRRRFQRFRPDMVMVFCRDLPLPLLQEFGRTTPVVLWMEEALHDLCPEHVEYMRHASLVCVSNPTRMPMLKEQGIERVEFLMSGFSPRFHHPERATPRRDVVFIGGPGQRGQRVELLARVSRHFDTEIYGVGWEEWAARYPELRVRPPVKARGFRHLCASSRIVLGLNQFNDDALYFSNRTWLSLACRGFHLTHYVPGLETVLRDGVHLAWYHDADECLEKIDHYLKDATARERIAAAGCELAHAKHQYYHRVGRVLELVEGRTTSASLSLSERLASRAPLNGHADGHLNGHANGHLNGHGSVQATRSTP